MNLDFDPQPLIDPNMALIVTRSTGEELWSAHVAVSHFRSRKGYRVFCRRCEAVVEVPRSGITYCSARLYPNTPGMQHKTCGQQFCFVE